MTENEESPIVVSVICMVYNHESYIRQCLDGFVMQKTNYRFEAVVHDDASTDESAVIIKEYADKYPNIIVPVLEKENLYSKQDGSLQKVLDDHIRGKYVALCEGDDYWTDPLKLQKQVDIMEANPIINICCHGSKRIKDGVYKRNLAPKSQNCIIPIEDVILQGGGMVATASIMYRRSTKFSLYKLFPLDYALQIDGSLPNGMLYLADIMSVYRLSASGSWSTNLKGKFDKQIEIRNKIIGLLNTLNKETEGRYEKVIRKTIKALDLKNVLSAKDFKKLLKWNYFVLFLEMPMKEQVKFILRCI